MGALDRLRAANGDVGIVDRARSNPRLVVAIAAGALLILAWIGWAVYVTSSNGAQAGLGVVIAWPAMLAALALISLPFIGGYLLIRRLTSSEGEGPTAEAAEDTSDEDEEDEEDEVDEEDEGTDDGPEDSAEEEDEEAADSEGDEDSDEDEDADEDQQSDDGDEEEAEPEAKASSKKG